MNILTVIKNAIETQQLVTFVYDGQHREVEPYMYGILGDKLQLHAYQITGGSHKGGIPEWRNFEIAKIKNIKVHSASHFTIRSSYRPEHAHYTSIQKKVNE